MVCKIIDNYSIKQFFILNLFGEYYINLQAELKICQD